jgi:hypothetical protein
MSWEMSDPDLEENSIIRMTGAMLVAPVDEARHIYRRVGWRTVRDGAFFDGDLQHITII